MYEGDCNQAVVFLFTLNYLNVRNNEYNYKFFRQIFKLEGLQGQRAAIVIRLYYEEEKQKAEGRSGTRTDLGAKLQQGKRNDLFPNGKKLNTQSTLAKMAGVGNGSIGRLTEVYRNRPDLFELVFDGTYTINKAYTPAHARLR